MAPTQPILIPSRTASSSSISSLSLSRTPPSPAFSELSLASSPSSDDDSDDLDLSDECCPTCTPREPPFVVDEADFTPLIIIGGGPHALALAARLAEPRPAALYTDLEHARLAWLQRERRQAPSGHKKKDRRMAVKGHWSARKLVQPSTATLAPPPIEETARPSIAVLDSTSSQWMGRWNGFFKGLRITHLRSPMFFQPSPADANALVAYAQRTGREKELAPICGVVGREFSKQQRKKNPGRVGRAVTINERSREDYYRPSTPLFQSFISSDLVNRYHLSRLITHTTVTSLTYRDIHIRGRGIEKGFVVESTRPDATTEVRVSKAAVMAIGPSSVPNIPQALKKALPMRQADEGMKNPWQTSEICGEGWCHSSAFGLEGCRPMEGALGERVKERKPTRVVVVGGGLTSAQIIDSLLDSGVSHVTLLLRATHIKTKHFDFDLEWVAKYANTTKMAFWAETDPHARWEQIQKARNGGSVNPTFLHILHKHQKSGRLTIHTLSEAEDATYDSTSGKWAFDVVTKPDPKLAAKVEPGLAAAEAKRFTLDNIDYLVSSTGSKIDLSAIPFVQPLLKSHPVELINGFPVLTADLQYNEAVPLFVMGAFSMLELGPDALNLSGTRAGAERVAHRLGELGVFDDVEGGGVRPVEKLSAREREKESRSGGMDNFFAGLEEVEM